MRTAFLYFPLLAGAAKEGKVFLKAEVEDPAWFGYSCGTLLRYSVAWKIFYTDWKFSARAT
jgi:hypothetical protein